MKDLVLRIVAITGRRFRVTAEEILGECRARHIKTARHVAIHLTREITGLSWYSIGATFKKDHTTCMHAHRRVREMLEVDAKLNSALFTLRNEIVRETQAAEKAALQADGGLIVIPTGSEAFIA